MIESILHERAAPSTRDDLERWLDRLVPAGDPLYTHTLEGPDGMPPGRGSILWEHRRSGGTRTVILRLSD